MSGKTAALRMLCVIPTMTLCSCNPSDERIIEMSQQNLERQAEQQRQMARHNEHITHATRQLIEADTAARQQLIESHGQLQQAVQSERLGLNAQQSELQRSRNELEVERRLIAQQRQRDPVIARALLQAAALLACSLPLLFCFCLLRTMRQEDCDGGLAELLVEEVLADQSELLATHEPTRLALGHKSSPPPPGNDHAQPTSPST